MDTCGPTAGRSPGRITNDVRASVAPECGKCGAGDSMPGARCAKRGRWGRAVRPARARMAIVACRGCGARATSGSDVLVFHATSGVRPSASLPPLPAADGNAVLPAVTTAAATRNAKGAGWNADSTSPHLPSTPERPAWPRGCKAYELPPHRPIGKTPMPLLLALTNVFPHEAGLTRPTGNPAHAWRGTARSRNSSAARASGSRCTCVP